jgi:flagellar motility protein MotE (MotC chaperone)
MTGRIGFPRLLPTTVVALALLLAVKSADLARAVLPAQAAEPAPTEAGASPSPPAGARAQARALIPANAQSPANAQTSADARTSGSEQAPPGPAPATKGSASASASSASPSSSSAPAFGAAPQAAPPVSDSERAVLLELRQRRQELDAREAVLSSREAVMAAAEQKIAARVDELQALQARLEALETARRARDQANWQGMVKLYEAMKPRDAAAIFNDLDMAVLLQVVDRMKEARAAAVMAAMQPEKARQVTTELAQMRNRANADPSPAGG